MTRDEFDRWFDYHVGSFPGIAGWLAKMPSAVQAAQLDAWFRVLVHIKAEEAHAATEQLFADSNEAPRFYEKHPQAVAAIARRSRENLPRYVDGKETYKCLLCEDDGRVIVEYEHARLGKRSYCAACTCEAGDYWATRSKLKLSRYDPKTMTLEGS